jgi:hypothetical protein
MAAHQFKVLRGTHDVLTNVDTTVQPPSYVVSNKVKVTYRVGDVINTDDDLSALNDQPGAGSPRFQKIF